MPNTPSPPAQTYDVCILHLADARFYPFFKRQAFALRDAGYKVALVSWENQPGEGNPGWPGVDCFPICIPTRAIGGKRFFVRYMLTLTRKLRSIPARLYEAVDPPTLWPARLAARHHAAAYNYFSLEYFQGIGSLTGRPLVRWFWRGLESSGLKRARNTAVVGETTARKLHELYGIAFPFVVRNVPELEKGKPEDTNRLRKQFAIPRQSPIVAYKGDVEPHRGLIPFLNVLDRNPALHFVIVGSGSLLENLRIRAREMNLSPRVHFLGRIPPEEFRSTLCGADLGLVLHEASDENQRITLPSRVFDYLHAGLPVLASDGPELSKVVARHKTGWTADPRQPESVQACVEAFLRLFPDLDELRTQSFEAAHDFCWQKEKDEYLRYIRAALGEQS